MTGPGPGQGVRVTGWEVLQGRGSETSTWQWPGIRGTAADVPPPDTGDGWITGQNRFACKPSTSPLVPGPSLHRRERNAKF